MHFFHGNVALVEELPDAGGAEVSVVLNVLKCYLLLRRRHAIPEGGQERVDILRARIFESMASLE